jgi:hypothetical protein
MATCTTKTFEKNLIMSARFEVLMIVNMKITANPEYDFTMFGT